MGGRSFGSVDGQKCCKPHQNEGLDLLLRFGSDENPFSFRGDSKCLFLWGSHHLGINSETFAKKLLVNLLNSLGTV